MNRNAAASFFAIGLLAALTWLHTCSRSAFVGPLLAGVLCGCALLLTQSRAGVGAAFTGLLVLAAFLGSRTAIMTAPPAILLGLLTGRGALERLARTDVTEVDRWPVFAAALGAIAERPWLGHGIGSFDAMFTMYRPASLTHHWDYLHNTWLEAAFDLGIPAAVLLCAAALLCWSSSIVAARRKSGEPAAAALAVAVGTMVGLHALLDFAVQMPANAVWVAVILGLGTAQGQSAVSTPGSSAKARR